MNTFNENQEQPDASLRKAYFPMGNISKIETSTPAETSASSHLFGNPDDMPYLQRDPLSDYESPRAGKSQLSNPLPKLNVTGVDAIKAFLPSDTLKGLILTGEVIGIGGSTSDCKLMDAIHRINMGTYEAPDTKEIPDSLRPLLSSLAMDAEISNLTQETGSKSVD